MRGIVSVAVASSLLWLGAGTALADGGASIATAPVVTFGQQALGNTATHGPPFTGVESGNYDSFWNLNVVSGDLVTIDWHGVVNTDGYGPYLLVYPASTTDFNVGRTKPADVQTVSSNGSNQQQFSAPTTGAMPIDYQSNNCFYACPNAPGAYSFTANVQHAVVLGVASGLTLSLSGSVNVSVRNPDGAAISDQGLKLQLQLQATGQPWTTVGNGTASGGATISYSIPNSLSGRTVSVRVLASGAGYMSVSSATQSVTLPTQPRPQSANLRLGHVSASRKHGATISGTTEAGVAGNIYVYASCWKAKRSVIVPDKTGRFSGSIKLPHACRRATSAWVGALWGGSSSFKPQQAGERVRIKR